MFVSGHRCVVAHSPTDARNRCASCTSEAHPPSTPQPPVTLLPVSTQGITSMATVASAWATSESAGECFDRLGAVEPTKANRAAAPPSCFSHEA